MKKKVIKKLRAIAAQLPAMQSNSSRNVTVKGSVLIAEGLKKNQGR